MTLNGIIALIFFTKFTSFAGRLIDYVTVVLDITIMSVKYCHTVPVSHFWPKLRTLQCGLSAIAEHLVMLYL